MSTEVLELLYGRRREGFEEGPKLGRGDKIALLMRPSRGVVWKREEVGKYAACASVLVAQGAKPF